MGSTPVFTAASFACASGSCAVGHTGPAYPNRMLIELFDGSGWPSVPAPFLGAANNCWPFKSTERSGHRKYQGIAES